MSRFDYSKIIRILISKSGNGPGVAASWRTRLEKYGPSGRANPTSRTTAPAPSGPPRQAPAAAMQWAQKNAVRVADANVGKGGPWDYTDVPSPELHDAIAARNAVAIRRAKILVWQRQLAKRKKIIHQASKTFLMQRYGIADVHRPGV